MFERRCEEMFGNNLHTSSAYRSRYSVIAACVGKSCSSSGKGKSVCCMSILGRFASSRSYLERVSSNVSVALALLSSVPCHHAFLNLFFVHNQSPTWAISSKHRHSQRRNKRRSLLIPPPFPIHTLTLHRTTRLITISPKWLLEPDIRTRRRNGKGGICVVFRGISPDTACVTTLFEDVDCVKGTFCNEIPEEFVSPT